MNILYIDPNMENRCKRYPYYSSMFRELKQISTCYFYRDKFKDMRTVFEKCLFKPDIIMFGIGWFSSRIFSEIQELKNTNIPIVCYLYKPQTDLNRKLNFCKLNEVDLILTPIPAYKKYEKITGISSKLMRYAASPAIFKDWGQKKQYDFGFSGSMHDAKNQVKCSFKHENLRSKIHNIMKKQKDLNCFLNGSDKLKARIEDCVQYAQLINKSKIWLATSAACEDMTPRYYEIPMSRTMLMCNHIPVEYQDVFRDGINCVQFSDDMSDFIDKVRYYLENDDERQKIINNAFKEFHINHTWRRRAEELLRNMKFLLEHKLK